MKPKCEMDAQHPLVADCGDFNSSTLIQRYDIGTTPGGGKVDVGNRTTLLVKDVGRQEVHTFAFRGKLHAWTLGRESSKRLPVARSGQIAGGNRAGDGAGLSSFVFMPVILRKRRFYEIRAFLSPVPDRQPVIALVYLSLFPPGGACEAVLTGQYYMPPTLKITRPGH